MFLSLNQTHHTLCRYAASAAAALLLLSCSAEIDEPEAAPAPSPEKNREVVTFTFAGDLSSRHTDTGFEEGDDIYIHAYDPGGLPTGWGKHYQVKNGNIVPYSDSQIITKEPGVTLKYIAQTEKQLGNEQWLYYGGGSETYDVLFGGGESASTSVALNFIHLLSQINVIVKKTDTQKVSKVELLNLYYHYEINLKEDYVSVFGTKLYRIPMNMIDENNYRYYATPENEIPANQYFICVTLTSGKTYYFYLKNDLTLEQNHAYFWEVDLTTATPSNAPSASPANSTGNKSYSAPLRLVKCEPLSPNKPIILKNK